MSDEAFREIQLNGKQLVFLFMAATVISVVIFLCGVMVGRGVHAEQANANATEASVQAPAPEPVAQASVQTPAPAPAQGTPAPAASTPPEAAPPAPAEENTEEIDRLVRGDAGKDTLKPRRAGERTPVEARADPASKGAAPPRAVPKPDQMPIAPGAWAVQIVALRERSEADSIAKRLVAKGYQAYVLSPGNGVFKVQVGRFKSRQDAEKTAARLKKEEQYSPWVTR
jgi:cell division septation protein DedD